MTSSGVSFLWPGDGRPFAPTRMWVASDTAGRDTNLDAWELTLEEPRDRLPAHVAEVADLKQWLLFGARDARSISYRSPRGRDQVIRQYQRVEVLRRYMERVLAAVPPSHGGGQRWVLVPTLPADQERTYKAALRIAIPEAELLHEAEMVVEYFRLVRRSLSLRYGRHSTFLVVDVGASTSDLTVVLSRTDRKMTEAVGGHRRHLRAVRGTSAGHAGTWVDEKLAEALGWREPSASMRAATERAKVRVAMSGVPTEVSSDGASAVLTPQHLASVAQELVGQLRPAFAKMMAQLWAQVTSASARSAFEEVLAERDVTGPDDVARLVDTVLLAGGGTQLPGFGETLAREWFSAWEPEVQRVGDAFPVAAAVGALAHVLAGKKGIRGADSAEDRAVDATSFAGSLTSGVMLGWRPKSGDAEEKWVPVLRVGEPFTELGGTRKIDGMPPFPQNTELRARLAPEGAPRRATAFRDLRVERAPGVLEARWVADHQELKLQSTDVRGANSLFLDLNKVPTGGGPSERLTEVPRGSVWFDAAPDVVVDFGMSKTVVVSAVGGLVSDSSLADACRGGSGAAAVVVPGPVPAVEQPALAKPVPRPPAEAPPTAPTDQVTDPTVSRGAALAAVEPPPPDPLPGGAAPAGSPWGGDFARLLGEAHATLAASGAHVPIADLVSALLATAVRPFVLLAGPPGAGKTTLVRVVAALLGAGRDQFHEIPVQAHWENDNPLYGEGGQLAALRSGAQGGFQVVLLDEFNLTRPEYYLARTFAWMDQVRDPFARTVFFGTLNVDDTSRPPSPKVVDRCFLLEVDAATGRKAARWPRQLPVLPQLGSPPTPDGLELPAAAAEKLNPILEKLEEVVSSANLRQDLLPSRRVHADLRDFLALHERTGAAAHVSLDDAIDRLLVGRVLVRIHGAVEQVKPLLDALQTTIPREFKRARRRLQLAAQQERLGFVSPWQ